MATRTRSIGIRSGIVVGVALAALLVAAAAVTLGVVDVPGLTPASSDGCRDVRQAGVDPALEQQVPTTLEGRGPDRLDSAVTCTAAGLGSLAGHGYTSVRSAGGLWQLGPSTGITLAVFGVSGPARGTWMAEFYAAGAATASKVSDLQTSHPTISGRPATRLDYLESNFPETIVVWPAADDGLVNVVLAAGVPDRVVQEGIAAFGDR